MAVEWPKRWDDVRSVEPRESFYSPSTYVEIRKVFRVYDGTLYINADAGEETDENPDLWVPFDMYLRRRGNV